MRVFPLSTTLEVVELAGALEIDADAEEKVWARWVDALAERPNLVDGRIFSVATVTPARITGRFVPYRWFVAQLADPALFGDTRVEPLAVTGRTCTSDGRVVFGLRADDMTQDAGSWELAPAGGVDPGGRRAGGGIDLETSLGHELDGELGIGPIDVEGMAPLGIVIDHRTHVHDVVFAVDLSLTATEVHERFRSRPHPEYEQLRFVPLGEAPASAGISPLAEVSRISYALPSARLDP